MWETLYIDDMVFDWDNNKNQSNLIKHGISFEEAIAIFADPSIQTFEDKYLSKINYTYLTPSYLLPLAFCLIFTRKLILHDYLPDATMGKRDLFQ